MRPIIDRLRNGIFIYDSRRKALIPLFPDFKKLEFEDGEEIKKIISKHPPYSAFHFPSLWSWDIFENTMLSILNDNLVVLFYDHHSDKRYLSFIGNNLPIETATVLLKFEEEGLENGILKNIPQETALLFSHSDYHLTLDESYSDHIISVVDTKDLEKCLKVFRNNCKRFAKLYEATTRIEVDELKNAKQDSLTELFITWAKNKDLDYRGFIEYNAFERYLELKSPYIKVLSIYESNKVLGFLIFEILPNGFAMCEFLKADINYKGIYQYITWKACEYLHKYDIKYMNLQVDMGINSLRKTKSKANPKFLLNTFIIKNNEF